MIKSKELLSEDEVFSNGSYLDFANEYRRNPELRNELKVNPAGVVANWGFPLQADTDVRIVSNTHDTFYLVLPQDPNNELSDESLEQVTGGTAEGCLSTASTVISCASSYSTLSTSGD